MEGIPVQALIGDNELINSNKNQPEKAKHTKWQIQKNDKDRGFKDKNRSKTW